MKARHAIAILSMLGAFSAVSQNVREDPQSDPVLDAIQEFKNRDKDKPNEVTVVLEDAPVPPAVVEDLPPVESPVLVTGKPPDGANVVVPAGENAAPAVIDPEESNPEPENGLAVRVEKLKSGNGAIDPSQVKLMAPFPAKPLASIPLGWHLDASESAPPFSREVEIAPGSRITLTIRPHLLVPDADGEGVFSISEPGYDNAQGYQQTATVGAILSNSIRQMDEDAKRLDTAIGKLQQLLVTLPQPEPQPEVKPSPPVRKR